MSGNALDRRYAIVSGRSDQAAGLVELGSNSVKAHLAQRVGPEATLQSRKIAWDATRRIRQGNGAGAGLGSEPWMTPLVSATAEAAQWLTERLDVAPAELRGFATGAFRELQDVAALRAELLSSVGIDVHLLSAEEEALLLAEGMGRMHGSPALLFDLGGASLQICLRSSMGCAPLTCSLPLGANGLALEFGERLRSDEVYATTKAELRRRLGDGPGSTGESQARALGTGGTLKAVVKAFHRNPVTPHAVRSLADAARVGIFPEALPARRRELLLPGLCLLEAFAEQYQLETISYAEAGVACGLFRRFVPGFGSVSDWRTDKDSQGRAQSEAQSEIAAARLAVPTALLRRPGTTTHF